MSADSNLRMYASPRLTSIDQAFQTVAVPQEAYLLHLAYLSSFYAASTSSPMNSIQLFDKSSLRSVHTYSAAHPGGITYLRSIPDQTDCLMSSGKDGAICIWDARVSGGQASLKLISPSMRALLCCDASVDGTTVVAGTELHSDEAHILFWDPRQPAAPLVSHTSTHSDDVTSVHFSRHLAAPLLLSGSSDGLVSLTNALEQDEDEAVLHVGNMGCSISQVGWIWNDPNASVWSASDMESFSTWSGELDHLRTVDMKLPSLHSHGRTWVTDYLVGCHSSPTSPLRVFVGSNEGDVALISTSLAEPNAPWTVQGIWTNGHAGIVRSLLWDEQKSILLTGGEDAKLNSWRISEISGALRDEEMEVDMA